MNNVFVIDGNTTVTYSVIMTCVCVCVCVCACV